MSHQAGATLSNVITCLFIFLFVYTAASKLLEFHTFQITLQRLTIIGNQASFIAIGLPVLELLIAALLVIKQTHLVGFYAAFLLMLVFSVYILYMLLFVPHLPCSCGGVLKSLSWKEHLVFNIFFTCLALLQVLFYKKTVQFKNLRSSFPAS